MIFLETAKKYLNFWMQNFVQNWRIEIISGFNNYDEYYILKNFNFKIGKVYCKKIITFTHKK